MKGSSSFFGGGAATGGFSFSISDDDTEVDDAVAGRTVGVAFAL